MNGNKPFLDTNILIYAHLVAGDKRVTIARNLLKSGGIIGIQQLNEFASVARRKLGRTWDEISAALETIAVLCPDPIPLSLSIHQSGIQIAQQYELSVYDSLVVAAAIEAECETLFSEDMQHGQKIGTLKIQNPFQAGHVN